MENPKNRRSFLKTLSLLGIAMGLSPKLFAESRHKTIMTVQGPIDAASLGFALIHEHILVDFVGADKTGYSRWDRDEVAGVVLPFLQKIKSLGCNSLFECTPAFLGRDPLLLRQLSDKSGLNLITNTGLYGAQQNKFLPDYAFSEPANALAARWIKEWENGIEKTGIRPGFIKIGIDRGHLSDIHAKLARAAARAHLQTGLTIASHTGTAEGAFEEFAILKEEGVMPDAFIWVHAQAEPDLGRHIEAAKIGAWVSLDNVNEQGMGRYLEMISNLRANGCMHRVLVSQDAGWYSPGEPKGGDFRGYAAIFEKLIPGLKKGGFSEKEIQQIFVKNPAAAFAIHVRKL